MRRALALCVTLALIVPSAAAAAERGEIGGPPTMKLARDFIEPNEQRSPALVIGKGRTFNGPVEIVAMDTDACLLVSIELPKQRIGSSTCGEGILGRPLEIASEWFSGFLKNQAPVSGYGGPVTTAAATVVATARRRGGPKRFGAVLAVPDAALAARLNIDEPFAYWAAVFPGCVTPKKFRVAAFDSAGSRIARTKGWGIDFCTNP